jgi:putative transposase
MLVPVKLVSSKSDLWRLACKFNPDFSITDLKALFRGYKYVEETIKLLPEKPDPVLMAYIFHRVSNLGRIHSASACSTIS